MATMDIPQVLEELGLGSQAWGPNAHTGSTYEAFASTWPNPATLPTKAAMLAKWAEIEGNPNKGKLRPYIEIYQDVSALTGVQKIAIWNDLNAGTPIKKLYLDTGPRADILAWADFLVTQANLGAAPIAEAKLRAVVTYVRDNPDYLVHPSFDNTINISGNYL